MRFFTKIILILLILVSLPGYSQECEFPKIICPKDGVCKPIRACRGTVPPPPGLPIDNSLPYLLVAGLGLGIYFLKRNAFKKAQ
jgi:hypothetical protein